MNRLFDHMMLDLVVMATVPPYRLKSSSLDYICPFIRRWSSSNVIKISSSSTYFSMGNTFFIDLVFGPSTQFIFTSLFLLHKSINFYGRSDSLFGNSYVDRLKYMQSGLCVFASAAYITGTQLFMRSGYDVMQMFMVDM